MGLHHSVWCTSTELARGGCALEFLGTGTDGAKAATTNTLYTHRTTALGSGTVGDVITRDRKRAPRLLACIFLLHHGCKYTLALHGSYYFVSSFVECDIYGVFIPPRLRYSRRSSKCTLPPSSRRSSTWGACVGGGLGIEADCGRGKSGPPEGKQG